MKIEVVPKKPKIRYVVHGTSGYYKKTTFGRSNCGLQEATLYYTRFGAFLDWLGHMDESYHVVKVKVFED